MKNCTFVILGATGDLTKRKLIPALYRLIQDKKIDNFLIVGAAIDQVAADEFIERGRDFISTIDENIWAQLKKASYYQKLDFNKPSDFIHLTKFVNQLEKEHNLPGNRIVYLAVPAHFFCDITEQIGKSGLVKTAGEDGLVNGVWQRIVYEKPFGVSLQSACKTNECIVDYFNENQIYRIDHYLTKELVSSIVLVRFTNMIFEPLWNKKYIDNIQIILSETLGVEGRGRYYDKYGALKDVVQNHMMQLLALVAMELPEEIIAKHVRDQKAAVLQQTSCVDGILGQYEGYRSEKDVARDSDTPTFAALKMMVDTPRWQGVPFYLKTGKALYKKDTSIHIKFKEVPCSLRNHCIYTSNYLTIQISPDASFSIQLNTKKPGATHEVTPINLYFSHNYVFGTTTPEAYEVLFEQIMNGEQSVSVRFDEIEYSWEVVDNIEKMNLPQYQYKQGSKGPEELQEFDKKNKIGWRA
ncbi:MAG: glucose-6-phosphate dehydrogenase [Candidatus Babeliales bacterium]